jgi:hypothetical protein
MPLRDLPTESGAAAALLRTEELQHRTTLRRTEWHGAALVCLGVGAALAVLWPGSASTGCYLWRATSGPVSGRGVALVLPVVLVALLLAERLCSDRNTLQQQVRGWGAVVIGLVTLTTWASLLAQGRSACETSPNVTGTVLFGGLAVGVATHWATRSPAPRTALAESAGSPENSSEIPLNQSELRAVFLYLGSRIGSSTPIRSAGLPLATGACAALLLLSTVLPWRELLDPVALGSGGAEAGLARVQLWEIPYLAPWAAVIAATALTTLYTAVATLVPTESGQIQRGRVTLLAAAGAATGVVVIVGFLTAVMQLPPRLSDGVGYRVAPGAWLALALGVVLLGLGATTTVLAVRRRNPGWSLQLGTAVMAGLVAAMAGVIAPASAGPAYRPEVVARSPHQLLDLRGGQLVDRLGMRIAIGTSDPLASLAGNLDGTPGQWLLGRTGSEGSTVFEYRDGVALPRVAVSHGLTPPVLLGVADNRMVLLAGGSGDRPWALLAVPLDLVAADVSLAHQNPEGGLYVTPGVDVLATGRGPAQARQESDRSIMLWDSDHTWQIPSNKLRPGLVLKQFLINPGPGAPGNAVSRGPDGTTAWRTSRTGLALVRPGGKAQQLTGIAPAACSLSSDVVSSSLTVDAFAVDVRGNVWLAGGSPAAVLTRDGVLRPVPGAVTGVDSIEARPDGTVLLGVSPAGGDQIMEIPDAAAAAESYPAAPAPTARCDRRKAEVRGTTAYKATVLPPVPTVEPPVTADGRPGRSTAGTSRQLVLDTSGRLSQLRLPNTAQVWAPDGQGGLWWTVSSRSKVATDLTVHLPGRSRTATVVRDKQPTLANQRSQSAAAAGDRLIATVGEGSYGLYGPGHQVSRIKVDGTLRVHGLALTSAGTAAMVLDDRLVSVTRDGKVTTLLGGAATGWPISTGIRAGIPSSQWSTDGNWFTGSDGKVWGYDGSHLYRVDGPGRVTLIAGPGQGVPPAADQITVIGPALYFELGRDVVRLEPTR